MNISRVQATDSTNRLLKQRSDNDPNLPEGTALVAWEQTSGRGQAGNFWEAEAGKNLTFSVLLTPTFLSAKQHFLLSKAVALAVAETLSTVLNAEVQIKWPNDMYVGERKIAGILIENDWQDTHIQRSIVGIGLNVNQLEFKSDAPNPVSIRQITGIETDLDALLTEILGQLYKVYERLKSGETTAVAQLYAQHLYRKTGFFDYEDKNERFRAEIQSVSDDGFIQLRTDKNDVRTYAFKEVRYL